MGHCESAMTKMALAAPPASCPLPAWTDALLSSATNVIGRKRVFPNSKPWFNDAEVQALHDEKRRAGVAVRSVPVHERDAAKVRLASLRKQWRTLTKRKRREHRESTFRRIERAQGDAPVFSKLWKSHTRSLAGRSGVGSAVLDAKGEVVCDSVGVLRAWRNYAAKLGRADTVGEELGDNGDRISSPEQEFDDEFARQVLAEVASISIQDGVIPELDRDISWEEVHCAIVSMAAGKAAGSDGIVVELLQAMGIAAETALARVFNFTCCHYSRATAQSWIHRTTGYLQSRRFLPRSSKKC